MQSPPIWSRIILLLLLIGCLVSGAEAQRRKKRSKSSGRKDYITVKAPSIRGKQKALSRAGRIRAKQQAGTSSGPRYSSRKRGPGRYGRQFVPSKAPTIVSEEPQDSLNDAETNLVEVEEQIRMDCTWVKVTEYYSLWDSRRVNPYGVDRKSLTDTVTITLYDTAMGAGYSPPIINTYPTSHFGARGGRFHYGTDLKLNVGDTVRAVWDGIVRITSFDARGYGYYVLVRHYNGLETLYGHLSAINCEVGQLVSAGQALGNGGNTGRSSGPHLHFEVRYQGNAINSEDLFDFPRNQLYSDQFFLSPDKFAYVTRAARKVYYHSVRPGDTMYMIASRYGLTVSELARMNGLSTKARLRAGRRLKVKT